MNLSELKKMVDELHSRSASPEEVRVGIVIDVVGSVGGTPIINIKRIAKGFDWDNNKLMIYPEQGLRKTDADELAKLRKEAADLGWSVYESINLKREVRRQSDRIQKLNKAIESVRGLINQSEGVAGLHLNGDIATWEELQRGGRFEERLIDFNEAE